MNTCSMAATAMARSKCVPMVAHLKGSIRRHHCSLRHTRRPHRGETQLPRLHLRTALCLRAPGSASVRRQSACQSRWRRYAHRPGATARHTASRQLHAAHHAGRRIGARGPITFLEHTPPIGLISHTVIRATIDRLKPYENYSIIRTGEIIEAEMAYVAESAQAAIGVDHGARRRRDDRR